MCTTVYIYVYINTHTCVYLYTFIYSINHACVCIYVYIQIYTVHKHIMQTQTFIWIQIIAINIILNISVFFHCIEHLPIVSYSDVKHLKIKQMFMFIAFVQHF